MNRPNGLRCKIILKKMTPLSYLVHNIYICIHYTFHFEHKHAERDPTFSTKKKKRGEALLTIGEQ